MPGPIKISSSSQCRPVDGDTGMTMGSAMDAAWGKLSDFEGWPAWIPAVNGARLLGETVPGRGARLEIDFGADPEEFTIAHWEPSRRLALLRQADGYRIAYAFDFHGEENQLCLDATVEVQCTGFRRLLTIPLLRRHHHRCQLILSAL